MAVAPQVDEHPMLQLLGGFIAELRAAGLPVSLTENLDAMEAIQHIPLEDRDTFKYALGATLVKNHSHWRAFEVVFEVYFSLRGAEYAISDEDDPNADADGADGSQPEDGDGTGSGGGGEAMSAEQLAEMLYQSLLRGDGGTMRAAARQAVRATREWNRVGRWEAPTICTELCGTSISMP